MTPAEAPDRAHAPTVGEGLIAALAAAGTGTWHWDLDSGEVACDTALERLLGHEPGEFPGSYEAWLETVHPDDVDDVVSEVQEAVERGGAFHIEHRSVWADGSEHWLEWRGLVLVDEQDKPVGTEGCVIDITARKVSEMKQEDLLEEVQEAATRLIRLQLTSQKLTAALSPEDVVSVFLEGLTPPRRATARALWMLDPTGTELVLAGQVGMVPVSALRFERMSIDDALPAGIAIRERRTVVSPSKADSIERFPVLAGVPRSGQGFVAVPLLVENRPLGVMAYGYNGRLSDGDLAFLEAAAGNVAQTLQRALLAGKLERRTTEVEFLSDITRAAISASDHRDLMQRIAETAVPRLGQLCAIHFVPEPGAEMETVAVHADPARNAEAQALGTRLRWAGGPHGVAEIVERGRTAFTTHLARHHLTDDPELAAEEDRTIGDFFWDLAITSAITVPMYANGQAIGALQVFSGRTGTSQTEREVALAEAIVLGMSEALANRWLTDQHRYISDTLQKAFLPPVVPAVPGVEIATAYWPAGEASKVGGDFYDVFEIDDLCWSLVIGDACGTGPDAAATAAIARHTARAAARHGLDHLGVLEWVNQAVKHSDRDLFCTACYATLRIDPDEDTILVEVAVGGHPLPIVVGPEGARTVGVPGTLLGVFEEPTFTVSSYELRPGEGIVFYTDGMTDLPDPHGRTPEELEAMLADHPIAQARQAVDALADDLAARAETGGRADDVALLVVWHPEDTPTDPTGRPPETD